MVDENKPSCMTTGDATLVEEITSDSNTVKADSDALQVDVMAATLRANSQESGHLVEWLAERFELSLPSQTTVVREGWLLTAKKVKEVTIRFDDRHFVLTKHKRGHVEAKELKVVKEIVLKTKDVPVETWIVNLARALSSLAERNTQAKQALADFMLGK